MVFSAMAMKGTVITNLHYKWVYYLYVFGFGIFLILVGLIQLFACRTENRWLIFAVLFFLVTCP